MKFTSPVFLAALSMAMSHQVVAEEQSPIIVTATRTAQTADDSLASVTVITRDDLEKSQAHSIVEVLQNVVGLSISRSGGVGKVTNVFLRGTESDHTLVLVDGVRAASATLGSFSWSSLSPEQIERIEIVRGARTSIYGSDAIGGVIQIFTRKNKSNRVRVSYGSNNTKEVNVSLGGGENWKYSLELGQYRTAGIPITTTSTSDRGYDNTHLALVVNGEFNQKNKLQVAINHAEGSNKFDAGTGDSDYQNRTISAELQQQMSSSWLQTFRLGHALDYSRSYSPFFPSAITTSRNTATWQGDVTFGNNLLTLGLDYWNDDATKDNSGIIDASINNKAAFAQYQFKGLASDWSIAARSDEHSDLGNQDTWNISWGHNLSKKSRLTLSHATAFKSASINDIYWPLNSGPCWYDATLTCITQGNINIKPEFSKSSEMGYRYKSKDTTFSANIFYTKTRDLIEWATIQTGATEYTTTPTNVSRVNIRGMELQLDTPLADWNSSLRLTLLDAKNIATGKQLDRRPKTTAAFILQRNFEKLHVFIELLSFSEHTDASGSIERSGYELINMAYGYSLSDKAKLKLRIDNLLDEDYVTASSSFAGDYSTSGVSAFIGLTYQF
jgi:vitamin B12 transporter